MEFQCGVVSDVGTTRKVNQDSACIHIQDSIVGNVGLAVVCDGMGGLSPWRVRKSVHDRENRKMV